MATEQSHFKYIGVDPGVSGGLSVIDEEGKLKNHLKENLQTSHRIQLQEKCNKRQQWERKKH